MTQTHPADGLALEQLRALAANLWWSWDTEATELWRSVDPYRWERNGNNPVALLLDVEPARWIEWIAEPNRPAQIRSIFDRFRAYMEAPGWAAEAVPQLGREGGVAYFSMEFGLHATVRTYSGGLGVLAGDHVRSASDLGLPLVAVGLLYREGYFHQLIDQGKQLAAYPVADWHRLPIRRCLDPRGNNLEIPVQVESRTVVAQVWELYVGRCRLLLLDTDLPINTDGDRAITGRLYGGDDRMRITQETVLGIGGVAALRAFGLRPAVYHLNEGHCAFVPVALAAEVIAAGATADDAFAEVRTRCVFTTHTPVPAGHDRFEASLVEQVLGPWCADVGLTADAIVDRGRVCPGDAHETLSMTVLALRESTSTNGVSALHGDVSRRMFHELFPDRAVDDVPVGSVTNGVHPVFWMAPEARTLFDAHLPGWRERCWDPDVWEGLGQITDEALWALRTTLRARLVEGVRRRGTPFDPHALTIGFARRFATYKRGALLLSQPDRLAALLDRGVQVVFSGKAHPRDEGGQQIMSEVVRFAEGRGFRDRIAFLEDYDMKLGALLTQGSDVWLNNPRRPHEASGTSGQKVCLNGGLNLSVLDGWWPEGFDGTNGWAIGAGEEHEDPATQDRLDAESLYDTLEREVVPLWTRRGPDEIPHDWLQAVRRSIESCVPLFTSHRMVRDYATRIYAPRLR